MIVKVCGLRDPDNIRAVERLPVDLCGFIFYPRSPRCVPDDEFHAAAVRSCRRPAVGVFVDASPAEMLRTAERFGLGWLQLHGDESPEACGVLRQRGFRIIKAIRVASAGAKTAPTTCCSTPAATVTAVRDDVSTGRCSTPMRAAFRFCSAAESTRSAPKRSGDSSIPVSRAWISTADSKRPRR